MWETALMISTQSLELRAGARLLIGKVTVRINNGDRIGFVGRNGAGKSTLAKVLAGETLPAGGQVLRSGTIGYLPQDPRTGDEEGTVVERILSVRGLDQIVARMRQIEQAMATAEGEELEAVMNRYTRADSEFTAAGGYGATAEAEAIMTSLGIPERLFDEPLSALSGGQRRRAELARILFSGAETLLLDEPTNHLDVDSIVWLREYLTKYSGGLVIISHDVNLIETVVMSTTWAGRNTFCNANKMNIEERLIGPMPRRRLRFSRSRQRNCEQRQQKQKLLKECFVVLRSCSPN